MKKLLFALCFCAICSTISPLPATADSSQHASDEPAGYGDSATFDTELTPEQLFQKGESYYADKDYAQAVKYYRQSAKQKYAPAQTMLGICYYNGEGVEKNSLKASFWLHRAAKQGDAQAELLLGRLYCDGSLNEQNFAEGKNWLRQAASHQDEASQEIAAIAQEILDYYSKAEKIIADFNKFNNKIKEYVAKSDIEAEEQKELVDNIANTIEQFNQKMGAIPGLVTASHYGDEQAQESLKALDLDKAHKAVITGINMLTAAEQGCIFVPTDIYSSTKQYDCLKPYDAYTRGKQAVTQGDPKGYALLESSARRGCNHAKLILACTLLPAGHKLNYNWPSFEFEGKSLSEADRLQRYLKWMTSAADNGSLAACLDLRQLYKEGTYVAKDSAKVFHYTKAAAQLKDPAAMYDLGTRYAQGIGCQKDRAAAVKWMKQAAHAGFEGAKQWIEDRRGHYAEISGGGISSLGYVGFGDSLYSVKQHNTDLTDSRINPAHINVDTLSGSSAKVTVDNGYTYREYYLSNDRVVKMLSEDSAYISGYYPDDSAWRNRFASLRKEIISAGYGNPTTNGSNRCEWHTKGLHVYLSYIREPNYIRLRVEMRADSLRKWQGPKIGGWEDLLQ
ncbi:SEL1-like repeat protein [bacterium]|nr:SEL1-like repeat protein [bacterium]